MKTIFKKYLFYIGVQPANNVVIVSGAQRVTPPHTHVSILPQIQGRAFDGRVRGESVRCLTAGVHPSGLVGGEVTG